MATGLERLKSEAAGLTAQERAELAQFLIRSLDPESDDDVDAAWDAELKRRVDEIRSGSVVGKPADQVFAESRRKHS